jgi:hypothetical protein
MMHSMKNLYWKGLRYSVIVPFIVTFDHLAYAIKYNKDDETKLIEVVSISTLLAIAYPIAIPYFSTQYILRMKMHLETQQKEQEQEKK